MRKLTSIALLASCSLLVPAAAFGGYGLAGQFGSQGFGAGQFGTGQEAIGGNRQFNSPGGIAVTGDGSVFVADTSNNRIERFSAIGAFQGAFGSFRFDSGSTKSAPAGFILPEGVASGSSGNIFVADNRNDRAVKYSRAGRFLGRLGRRGSGRDEMVSPWGIAVGGSTVYVVDQGNHRILRYSTSGRYLGSFGHFGTGPGGIQAPYGIAATASRVYVSDTKRHQVDRFDGSGRLLGTFGAFGTGSGQFRRPAGLAVDQQGNVLVADCQNQRIERFTATGAYLETFGVGLLADPTFVAVGPSGQVYVSDFRRVVRFSPIGGASTRGNGGFPVGRSACVSQAEAAEHGG